MSTSDAARPYTDEELAAIRIWDEPRNDGPLATWPMDVSRWLATLAAREAEIAALRTDYAAAVRALDEASDPRCHECNVHRDGEYAKHHGENHLPWCSTGAILSTPSAQAALKEGQS